MSIYYKKIKTFLEEKIFYLIGIFSVIVLLSALYIDYILEFDPCPLCIYQRIPYLFSAITSFIAIILKARFRLIFLQIMIIIHIAGASISIYHMGIERNWWSPSKLCKPEIRLGENTSLDEFKHSLNNLPIGDCSKPALQILGFSLAEINTIISFIIIFFLIRIYRSNEEANF
jgi:disulfide bond formation protein DsbB